MTSPPLSNIVSLSAAGSNQTDVNGLINGVSYDKLIVNVWATNLREEMAKINEIVDDYPYVGMVRRQRYMHMASITLSHLPVYIVAVRRCSLHAICQYVPFNATVFETQPCLFTHGPSLSSPFFLPSTSPFCERRTVSFLASSPVLSAASKPVQITSIKR